VFLVGASDPAEHLPNCVKNFREVVANVIIHREYTNAHPCSFIIQKDKIIVSNANNPHGEEPIDPTNFAPYPKNPTIAKIFIQLGRADELGSGVLNVHKLMKKYVGKGNPSFVEGIVFSMELPIPVIQIDGANEGAFEGLTSAVKSKLIRLIFIISANEGKRAPEIQLLSGYSLKTLERFLKI
jgi:ATP-dependent DNA helicase RecG